MVKSARTMMAVASFPTFYLFTEEKAFEHALSRTSLIFIVKYLERLMESRSSLEYKPSSVGTKVEGYWVISPKKNSFGNQKAVSGIKRLIFTWPKEEQSDNTIHHGDSLSASPAVQSDQMHCTVNRPMAVGSVIFITSLNANLHSI